MPERERELLGNLGRRRDGEVHSAGRGEEITGAGQKHVGGVNRQACPPRLGGELRARTCGERRSCARQPSLRRVAGRQRGSRAAGGGWRRRQVSVGRSPRSAPTSAEGAHARSAGGRASVPTSAKGADARSEEERASDRTSAKGANARSVGWGSSDPRPSSSLRMAVDRQRNIDV